MTATHKETGGWGVGGGEKESLDEVTKINSRGRSFFFKKNSSFLSYESLNWIFWAQ